jgi:hypothetical protein
MPAKEDLTLTLSQMPNGVTRLIVWKDNRVIEIIESSSIRQIFNQQLKLARRHGFTEEKFKVRK